MNQQEDQGTNAQALRDDQNEVNPVVQDMVVQGTVIGHRVGGTLAGPQVLVAGISPLSDLVYKRLLAIPTLGWMRGQLTLVNLTKLDAFELEVGDAGIATETPDEVMFLPYDCDPAHYDQVSKEGCWAILRLCTQLGMISGRGVRVPAATDLIDK